MSSSLNCTTNVTANHRVGDQAKSVTVTGTATCTEVAYDQKGALTIASNALKAEAAKNPGAGYALVGKVVTSITSATVINKQNTVSLVILAQGVWVYQFTDAIKTDLKNKIAKESESKAQTDVNGTTGVMSATISISSGNDDARRGRHYYQHRANSGSQWFAYSYAPRLLQRRRGRLQQARRDLLPPTG